MSQMQKGGRRRKNGCPIAKRKERSLFCMHACLILFVKIGSVSIDIQKYILLHKFQYFFCIFFRVHYPNKKIQDLIRNRDMYTRSLKEEENDAEV